MKGIVLSELLNESEQEEASKPKPIKLVKWLGNGEFVDSFLSRSEYPKRLVLLARNYSSTEYDAIWAHDGKDAGLFYLGHWNDGVTE
jgi:hypothetical protein